MDRKCFAKNSLACNLPSLTALEGSDMQHDHMSFSDVAPAKKAWTSPVLTSTKLTEAERREASFSCESIIALGVRLRAQGRI